MTSSELSDIIYNLLNKHAVFIGYGPYGTTEVIEQRDFTEVSYDIAEKIQSIYQGKIDTVNDVTNYDHGLGIQCPICKHYMK